MNPPAAEPAAAGPSWFRRMDRNRDGDVSRREFRGPRAQFDRLDRDKDGLIDPAEAEAAATTASRPRRPSDGKERSAMIARPDRPRSPWSCS